MSDRVIIRQCIIPIIEEHLKDNLEPNTIKMYQQIIDHGVSEERAIELLAFYFEIYVKENFFSDEFDSKKWKKFLDKLTPIYHCQKKQKIVIQQYPYIEQKQYEADFLLQFQNQYNDY